MPSTKEHVRFPTDDDRAKLQREGARLSRSTVKAKWIDAPDEHEDRKGQTLATRSHDVIRGWASERKARPATVTGTEHRGRAGVLRFAFGDDDGPLQGIDWDEWFSVFDDRELIFLFQEHLKNGRQSNFFKLDSPGREDG